VLVTKTHKVDYDDVNGAVLCDADLSVLGSDAPRYRTYAAAVRKEYADVPDDAFSPLGHRYSRHCSTGRYSTRQPAVCGGSRSPATTSPRRFAP
jgi:hypothetical protein